jgi:DNA invertase Pin-like site-specific DNA recombinase
MRLIAYLRVSTERQEDGLGLDVQQDEIRAWARRHRHKLVEEIAETVSGKLEDRQGMASALQALRSGEADGIVVLRLDRLARDLIVQEQLLAEVRRHGELFSTSEAEQGFLTDDPDDPSRKMIRQVLGAVNEFERAMIALRLRNGRRQKAQRGGYAWGRPGYGYRAEGGELVAVPDQLDVIKRMKAMKRKRLSLRAIAETLNLEGVPSPTADKPWSAVAVQRALKRAGATTTRKRSGKAGKDD